MSEQDELAQAIRDAPSIQPNDDDDPNWDVQEVLMAKGDWREMLAADLIAAGWRKETLVRAFEPADRARCPGLIYRGDGEYQRCTMQRGHDGNHHAGTTE